MMERMQMVHAPHLRLTPLPALTDNYIWALDDGQHACVVDPGDDAPVFAWLEAQGLVLRTILLTHHHADHTGGVAPLVAHTGATAFGPAFEALPPGVQRVSGGQTLDVLGHPFRVIDVPGHTAGHIAWFGDTAHNAPILFCGDTLFSGGCGRLFEGTPAQMWQSLSQLAALPGHTLVCCAHEYTLSNLRFAQAVEPNNTALQHYTSQCEQRRQQGQPTLPSHMAQERAINPFLRLGEPTVRQAALSRAPHAQSDAELFAALRQWKDQFKG
jgi:hydroxyacylglutathione hydrolase